MTDANAIYLANPPGRFLPRACLVPDEAALDYFYQLYLVVAPDLRGYNESAKPTGIDNYAMAPLVADIEAIRKFFNKQKFILTGHDWGGFIAWAYASHYPQHLEKLIIINAPHPTLFKQQLETNTQQQQASSYIKNIVSENAVSQLQQDNFSYLYRILQFEKAKQQQWLTQQDIDHYVTSWEKPHALESMCHYYQNAFKNEADKIHMNFTLTDSTILLPTLIIWGELDKALLVDNLLNIEKYVPDCRVKLLSATHWVVREKSAEVTRALEAFITNNTTPSM